ncbi:MAG: adenylate/guanylate cyclase domain-containing protein [Saprospiraceae bacterium]|nr:adenylate/guanylate cyclase domain-containing protein [Saprospiraceae bacterium]
MQIPFVQNIIQKHYSHFDEDEKRNVTIYLILEIMMLFVIGTWAFGFVYLKMWEMFWLVVFTWSGYAILFAGAVVWGMPFWIGRSAALLLALVITGVPPVFYGMDTMITVHLVFVPLATILLFSRKEKKQFLWYLGLFFVAFLVVIAWNLTLGPVYQVPAETFRIFNTIVTLDSMFISLYFAYFFFTQNAEFKDLLATEREKSDRLLLSLFPDSIAGKLRNSNQSIADSFDNVTILFADIVGFTRYAGNMSPNELVAMLDEIFSEFDALADKYGVEKIKTIGDCYLAVGGLPEPDEYHCQNIANMALEINQVIKSKYTTKYNLTLRIGIHTGQAVAGVIGNKKFVYDIWGDSVNIASRFEASGHPEKIHITQDVKNVLGDDYVYEDCGQIEVKGKGLMHSYYLLGRNETKATTDASLFLSNVSLNTEIPVNIQNI